MAVINLVPQLAKLHRYERRARSRSMLAMREFWQIKNFDGALASQSLPKTTGCLPHSSSVGNSYSSR